MQGAIFLATLLIIFGVVFLWDAPRITQTEPVVSATPVDRAEALLAIAGALQAEACDRQRQANQMLDRAEAILQEQRA